MTDIRIETATRVPIRSLTPHPDNARIGNIDLIEQSLATHGQYVPIVINQDGVILAGHHVVQAAKRLKWRDIAAVTVTVSDTQAKRILLADNRCADLASYNEPALLELIESLPDLDGTGFGPADIAQLDALINDPTEPDEPATPSEPDPLTPTIVIKVGPLFQCDMQRDAYDAWVEHYFSDQPRTKIITQLKTWLDMPTPPKVEKQPPRIPGDYETVPINDIEPHPHNPREGDIGAVITSLQTNGQYRPITVNRQTNRILKGNHTYYAAHTLGWDRIAVHWIDVPPSDEDKILLIDNRTSDLATYHTDTLKRLLAEITDYTGTGYTHQDAADILNGAPTRPGPRPTGQTTIRIGDYGWRTPTDLYNTWAEHLDLHHVLARLNIDPTTCG